MRLPAPSASSQPLRAIDRELGVGRHIGGVASPQPRRADRVGKTAAAARPMDGTSGLASAPAGRPASHPGGEGPSAGRIARCEDARSTYAVLAHASACTSSFQPATACDRSGARDRSSHRRGGEAMAAAAYPGTRHQPVLGVRDASGARGVFRCRPHSRAYASKPYPRFKQWTVARPMHAAPMQC